jgi:hypothetical protein
MPSNKMAYKLTSTEIKEGKLCTKLCTYRLRNENHNFIDYINQNISNNTINIFEEELRKYIPSDIHYEWCGYQITIKGGSSYSIKISNKDYTFSNIVCDTANNLIALITESSTSREDNILLIFNEGKQIKKIERVSKELAISQEDKLIYYISENKESGYHHYDILSSITYNGYITSLYIKPNVEDTFHLSSDSDYKVYLIKTTYDRSPEVIRIAGNLLNKVDRSKYYIGEELDYASIINSRPTDDMIGSNDKYHIYINNGVSRIYDVDNKTDILIITGWIDPVRTGYDKFLIRPIDSPPYLYIPNKDNKVHKSEPSLSYHTYFSGKVPIITVQDTNICKDPTKTLIAFYGAYGLRTRIIYPYIYWAPLLKRGWRICFILARGGGDNGPRWAMNGRKSYHKTTINDVINAIKFINNKYNTVWSKTAIYSRSAGGIPAGIVTLMGLVGISFMEHPFVDIVETMSNPALPLTAVEYGEFGNPARVNLTEVSPINCISCVGKFPALQTPKVLLRTGEEDTQVYAYEPLKFAERLRDLSFSEVLLGSEKHEGHFYGADIWLKSRARDLAILDHWASAEKISSRDIKMAKTHRNKNARRNKNSQRNKTKSKNMEGGKRKSRKATRRTRRRVGRKH